MTTKQPSRRGRPPKSNGPTTRDRIIDAALEVFSVHGYDGATMRQIAAKVGVSDPALYSHFKGKKAIFEALMQVAGPDLLGAFSGDKPLQKMAASTAIPMVFNAIVLAWTTPRARAFTSLILRMGPEGIGNALREISGQLNPVFTAWQNRGELRNDIPAEVAIWQVIGPLAGLRLAYLHGAAKKEDIARATGIAQTHLEYVVEHLTLERNIL